MIYLKNIATITLRDTFNHKKNTITYYKIITYINNLPIYTSISDDHNKILSNFKSQFNITLLNKLFLKFNIYNQWEDNGDSYESYDLVFFNPSIIKSLTYDAKGKFKLVLNTGSIFNILKQEKNLPLLTEELNSKIKLYNSFNCLKIIK